MGQIHINNRETMDLNSVMDGYLPESEDSDELLLTLFLLALAEDEDDEDL